MPFEPLQTDEKIANPTRERDIDTVLMSGCASFGVVSVVVLALVVWPFFVYQDLHSLGALAKPCAIAMIPASLVGALASRQGGVPGASGFFGGALASAIFLSLRLEQAFLRGDAEVAYQPQYPHFAIYFIPFAWVIWAAIVGLFWMRDRK